MFTFYRSIAFLFAILLCIPCSATPPHALLGELEAPLLQGKELPVALKLESQNQTIEIVGTLRFAQAFPGYAVGVLTEHNSSIKHVIDFALLEKECQQCTIRISTSEAEAKQTRNSKAFYLIDDAKILNLKPKNSNQTQFEKLHFRLMTAYLGAYMFGALPLLAYVHNLRDQHLYNWFTLHQSNFTEGVALMGFAENMASLFLVNSKLQKYSLLLSSLGCAVGNLYCEFIETLDPADLASGLLAIPAYAVISKITKAALKRKRLKTACSSILIPQLEI